MEPIEEKIQISVGPPSTRGRVIKIIAGVIILTVIGVGISLYTRAWDPFWNPFRPSPVEIIGKMTVEMGKLKTVHSRAEMSIDTKEEEKKGFEISMIFASDLDNTDSENSKSVGDFYIALAFEGMEFSLAGESKTIKEDSYFKLTTIPALPFLEPFFEMLGIDLGEIKGQWIKLDMEEETQGTKERQEEITQKLQALFKDKRLYIVKREFADKEIRNVETYHYLVALDKEEIKKIIPELYKILIDTIKFGSSPTEEQWQEFQKELSSKIDEFFEKVGEITAELWIGKKDHLLYKVKGEKEIDLAKIDPKSEGKIIIKIEMDFSNFNQPLIIEAPEGYKTLEEILKPLETQAYQKVVDDMLSISSLAGLVYFPDYSDISCENKQIGYYCDDIEKYVESKPVIHRSRDAYCAYVEILPTQYFCIDSQGAKYTVFVYPGIKSYCDGKTFICPPAAPPGF